MRKFRRNRSGQVLIITALAIAFIISSTIVYVYQTSRVSGREHPFSPQDYVRIVKLGSRNLVIGSLANISYGGDNQTLETNLERWCSFVESQYYFGECRLSFSLCETSPYSSGLRIFWGEDGSGVTSAKTDFSMNLTDGGTEMTVAYPINVTTSLSIAGTYQRYSRFFDIITVTISLHNEGEPALVKNLTVYYEAGGVWNDAGALDNYSLEDFGNGTYRASFLYLRWWTYRVLVVCYDQREIYVQAITTCIRV